MVPHCGFDLHFPKLDLKNGVFKRLAEDVCGDTYISLQYPGEKRIQSENVIFKVNADQLGIRIFFIIFKEETVISI